MCEFRGERPVVVCLCGSTRFWEAFQQVAVRETIAGRVVLKPEVVAWAGVSIDEAVKARLDALHLRKIDMADEILVVNVGGYIGRSTRREIAYARQHGKRVRWLVSGACGDRGHDGEVIDE